MTTFIDKVAHNKTLRQVDHEVIFEQIERKERIDVVTRAIKTIDRTVSLVGIQDDCWEVVRVGQPSCRATSIRHAMNCLGEPPSWWAWLF